MTTMTMPTRRAAGERPTVRRVDELHSGDRLKQAEFLRRYELTEKHVKAELIGGIVYMASPVRASHGDPVARVTALLGYYEFATPGVRASCDTTVRLGEESVPQPDAHLRLTGECGGASKIDKTGYLSGPPELVVEVAHSSEAIDLHAKRLDYQEAGVPEYVVLCVNEGTLRAFDLARKKPLAVDADRVYRSKIFPGLWIDGGAVLSGDTPRMFQALHEGLKSPEHAAFAKKLKAKQAAAKAKAGRRDGRRKS